MKKIYRCEDCGTAVSWERGRGKATQTHVLVYCHVCRGWKWIARE